MKARVMQRKSHWLLNWWPLAVPLLGILAVYLADAMQWNHLIAKQPHETAALVLLSVALLVSTLRLIISRDRLHLVMTVAIAAMLCREIHFAGTHRGIYIAAALVALWCILWHRSLLKLVRNQPKGRWIVIAAWAYIAALLIQRRACKFLPDEQRLHVRLEEVLENIAHLFMIILALIRPANRKT